MEFIQAKEGKLFCGKTEILLRGFGLGGWLLPEGYMWKFFQKCDRPRRMEALISKLCGEEYAENFWKTYYDTYITEGDIQLIAQEGFNSLRLPINARHLYHRKGNAISLQEDMLLRLDMLLEWCKKYQIYVILDMHGAPGGQTGQNIDDSEKDQPELFLEEAYEEELVQLWSKIAERYASEACIAGYDLLNEPLPNRWKHLNDKVLPLYRRLIKTIRKVDEKHLIILEGVHWATDFSIFDSFTKEEAADNILLQFHKYWSEPDRESLEEYVRASKRLRVPLFMGEGGENNCEWYTTIFPLYERLNMSWNFWSYKKMECDNSPVTFRAPRGWEKLLQYLEKPCSISQAEARKIFDAFLYEIKTPIVNGNVFRSLKRETPISIPAEAFDDCEIHSKRRKGADLRLSEQATLLFENGKTGKVDYQRYGGEKQPMEENLVLHLEAEDRVYYDFKTKKKAAEIKLEVKGEGKLECLINEIGAELRVGENKQISFAANHCNTGKNTLQITCMEGYTDIDLITIL